MTLNDSIAALSRQFERWSNDLNRAPVAGHRDRRAVEARALMARLRRGLGKSPAEAWEAYGLLVPYLPEHVSAAQREMLFLTATLFAEHPLTRARREPDADGRRPPVYNLGDLCRALEDRPGGGPADPAGERRFQGLLRADATMLPIHLRRIVRLAAAKSLPLDYYQLLRDLLNWSDPVWGDRTRLAWADHYWRLDHSSTDDTDSQGKDN